MKYAVWIIQILLALLFMFAGVVKLITPIEQMTSGMPIPVPGGLLRFVAVAEIAGSLGLIFPAALGIRPVLTPLAAAGLVIIMIGATVLTLMSGMIPVALISMITGVLCAFVAYARTKLV